MFLSFWSCGSRDRHITSQWSAGRSKAHPGEQGVCQGRVQRIFPKQSAASPAARTQRCGLWKPGCTQQCSWPGRAEHMGSVVMIKTLTQSEPAHTHPHHAFSWIKIHHCYIGYLMESPADPQRPSPSLGRDPPAQKARDTCEGQSCALAQCSGTSRTAPPTHTFPSP